jgi:hypothetical protein
VHRPNLAPGRAAPRLRTSSPRGCVAHPLTERFRQLKAPSFRTSTSSTVTAAAPLSGGNNGLSSSQTSSKNPGAHWPPEFYADFTSRVWITYRSHFYPIRDSSLTVLEREQAEAASGWSSNADFLQSAVETLVVRWREGVDERRGLGLHATNGSIVTCDGTHTSTFRARYVKISFVSSYLLTSPKNGGVPLNLCIPPIMRPTSRY